MLTYKETGGKIMGLDGKVTDFWTGRQLAGSRGIVAAWNGTHNRVLDI
jgi:hypothetical protein